MSWNYRITEKNGTYGIHEVYYNDEGEPNAISEEAVTLGMLETLEDLKGDLELINRALTKPVISYYSIAKS